MIKRPFALVAPILAALVLTALLLPLPAALAQSDQGSTGDAATSGLPLPRFVSLRADEVRLRTGPGQRYPIEWVYHRRGLPVEIIEEYENWRRIRDLDGTVGWVHSSLLDSDRTLVVVGELRPLRAEPAEDAAALAYVEPGVILNLEICDGIWCQAQVEGYEGWVRRDEVWGVYADEILQ